MTSYTHSEIQAMSGTEQAQRIRDGRISPVDAVDASLERIEELDPKLNAFSVVAEEQAKKAARDAERAIENDESVGPLHGVPVAIKDLITTKGIRTTFGSRMYEDHVPDEDSVVVGRIKDAGGIIIGKTNVPEFGYQGITENDIFGKTHNPWDIDRTPGGSSGGSGAAVATGMVPLALGSDGGGSVRIPASFCGLYGIKGSFGRVPVFPDHRDPDVVGGNGWESIEHIGPLTRTVADSALLMDVLSGPHHMDRHSLPDDGTEFAAAATNPNISGLRIAYSQDWGHAAVDSRVRELTADAVTVFEDLGCTVENADPGFGDFVDEFTAIVANDSDLSGLRAAHERGELNEELLINIIETEWDAEDFTDAKKERQRLNVELRRFMKRYDLVVTPTLAVPPFDIDSPGPTEIEGREVPLFHWLSFTFPINLTGNPAATIPAGWTDEGLPVGLQLIGTHLDDRTVIEASAAYEAANSWQGRYFPTV